MSDTKRESSKILLEIKIDNEEYDFSSTIADELNQAKLELTTIEETIETLNRLKPSCDKLDYTLATSSGALIGIIDIFLVAKPGDSTVGNLTDKWFAERVNDFAKHNGWKDKEHNSLSSAIRFLEKKFKVPYDQRGAGDAGRNVFGLNPSNHHFKSLGHNPSILGLFFSILDQFTNSSHFISNWELISLVEADEKFELRGHDIPSKLFSGIANWFGHLISDVSGASGSIGRGMGIPSPLWTWTNDIIAIKKSVGFPVSEFNKNVNELAIKLFTEGYDIRFQVTQAIPVFINEVLVRFLYALRRLIKYFAETDKESRSFKLMWKYCEPFSNPSIKRMLTVAHGTFCIIDAGDATIRGVVSGGGGFDPTEFFLRLNIIGVGRFTISLYGEFRLRVGLKRAKSEVLFLKNERIIIENYIDGLKVLSDLYDDRSLLNFIDDFTGSDIYRSAFAKSVNLAEKRKTPNDEILKNKMDIDSYFLGRK